MFADVSGLQPEKAFHPFEMNAAIWLPGVVARRWINVPNGKLIKPSVDADWQFPEGTQIVQHFDTAEGARHETHVYTSNGDGSHVALAYRWASRSRAA